MDILGSLQEQEPGGQMFRLLSTWRSSSSRCERLTLTYLRGSAQPPRRGNSLRPLVSALPIFSFATQNSPKLLFHHVRPARRRNNCWRRADPPVRHHPPTPGAVIRLQSNSLCAQEGGLIHRCTSHVHVWWHRSIKPNLIAANCNCGGRVVKGGCTTFGRAVHYELELFCNTNKTSASAQHRRDCFYVTNNSFAPAEAQSVPAAAPYVPSGPPPPFNVCLLLLFKRCEATSSRLTLLDDWKHDLPADL